MKSFNIKNTVIIALMVLAQTFAFANNGNPDQSTVSIKSNDKNAISLSLKNLGKMATSIAFKDAKNDVLFEKEVNDRADIAIKLDLSLLQSGNYSLFINRKQKTYVQAIELKSNEVVIGKMIEIVKPVIGNTKKGFAVTNPAADVKSVEVLNNSGNSIYTKAYDAKNAKLFKIRYSMKDVPAGNYTVKVTTKHDAYYKDVVVK